MKNTRNLLTTRWTRAVPVVVLAAALSAGCESGVSEPQALSGETAEAINILPADARIVGMVDFQSLAGNDFTSPFSNGPFALEKLGDEPGARVRDFLSFTGLDPETDLDRAYFAATGTNRNDALVVAYADYDTDKLLAFLRQQSPVALSEVVYRDIQVFTAEEDGHAVSIAIANGSMVLAGQQAAVQAAIDRLVDRSASLASNASMMLLLRRVSHTSSWIVADNLDARSDHAADHDGPLDDALASTVGSAAFGLTVGSAGVRAAAHLAPRDGVRSGDLEDLVKGAISAMKANAPGKDGREMLDILDDVTIRRTGDVVRVDVDLDNAALARIDSDL